MKKWVRNILLGFALSWLKDTKFVKKIVEKLKNRKTLVGRLGLGAFTILAAVKYYSPDLPIDDSVDVLGMVFSWLALEIGLDKSEVENIEAVGKKEFDPNQKIDLGGFELPAPASLGLSREKTISSDDINEA